MGSAATDSTTFSLIRKNPASSYFLLTFAISWTAAFFFVAPKLFQPAPLPKLTGILMFPAMLLGPSFAGIFLTRRLDGPAGLKNLLARMLHFRFSPRWYSALLIPPLTIFCVLLLLKAFVSPIYTPNHFWVGGTFGILAGFLEEIGWSGVAYPRLRQRSAAFPAAAILGLFWGLWHAPVIDFLGAASPDGKSLPAFFTAFIAAMAAVRVLICWFYERTQSIALAQLIHISSTGSLVVFGPFALNPAQETLWYTVYAMALWLFVLILTRFNPLEASQP
jgi:membrane protease YdiL (CAAX protease family)